MPAPPGYSPPRWPRGPRFQKKPAATPVGGLPNAPVDIPITWFSQPLSLRLQKPINHAEVTQSGGATAYADNAASIATYNGVFPFIATLDTAQSLDAANLAAWKVAYNPALMTAPRLVLNLLHRTDAEKLIILGVTRGERIRITGLPNEWPASARSFVIAGTTQTAAVTGRVVEWTTGPVIGVTAGTPGPWFRLDSSLLGGADIVPF